MVEMSPQRFDRRLYVEGCIHPRGWPKGSSQRQVECLVEGSNPSVEVVVRLLQTVERQVLNAVGEPVEDLTVTGRRHQRGEEAIEHEVRIPALPNRAAVVKTAGSDRSDLVEGGARAGTLLWRWEPLHVTVEAWTEELGEGCGWYGFASQIGSNGRRRSRADPDADPARRIPHPAHPRRRLRFPRRSATAPARLPQRGPVAPVPVGEAGDRRTVLASPIPLDDYPQLRSERLTDFLGRGIAPRRAALR